MEVLTSASESKRVLRLCSLGTSGLLESFESTTEDGNGSGGEDGLDSFVVLILGRRVRGLGRAGGVGEVEGFRWVSVFVLFDKTNQECSEELAYELSAYTHGARSGKRRLTPGRAEGEFGRVRFYASQSLAN